ERGATVLGIDNSPEMIAAARANGVDAVQLAAEDMQFFAEFNAAFSNATLHWVLQKEQAARAIFRALKAGCRFAGEMGGEGNLARLREALDEELIIRGYLPPVEASNWYASPEEFAAVYEAAGFREVDARLIDDLFRDVPEALRLKGPIEGLPLHASEMAVERHMAALSRKNMVAGDVPFFLGCGAYRHHVPASADHIIQRGEFLTSYTPYQP